MPPQPQSRPAFALGAVLLAAGRSTRMGRPKLLLPWRQTSVLGHLLKQWQSLGAKQIAMVVRAPDRPLERELHRLGVPGHDRIVNRVPERGMFSSIQCAALWDGWDPQLTHWVIILGDQPHLRPATLRALVALADSRFNSVCQPAFNGHPRHPVVLPRALFLKLSNSKAANLKDFLATRELATFSSDDPGLDLDIDRPEDYEKALALAAEAPSP